ncbi:MAG: TetR/AcrR family transcriptional regulator [Cyclobacteriaceae bacterium]|nr:TetR/AcrR family transcriptional regulator [Cyclobacteriaceae bacterium]
MTSTQETEQVIKDTAREIFFQKGRLKATTQEIADEAGVNRALIHYYFRSREQLLQTVFEEAVSETRTKISDIFKSKDPFKKKISQYLDVFIDRNIRYPYMQNFIISEINTNPEKEKEYLKKKRQNLCETIFPQLEDEISKGTIDPIKPEHFMANLMSMCSYPLVAKPILQGMFDLDENEYKTFLKERKKVIYKSLFNEEADF